MVSSDHPDAPVRDARIDDLLDELPLYTPPESLDDTVQAWLRTRTEDDTVAPRSGVAIEDLVDDLPAFEPPPDLDRATRATVRTEADRASRRPRLAQPRRRWAQLALTAAVAAAAGLAIGTFQPHDRPEVLLKGVGAVDPGQLSVRGSSLGPIENVRVGVGSGLRPSLRTSGPVQVEWRVPDPVIGRLVVWWVAPDGTLRGVSASGEVTGSPRILPPGTRSFEVDPPGSGTLVVAVSTGLPPDPRVLAETVRDGRVAHEVPPVVTISAFDFDEAVAMPSE